MRGLTLIEVLLAAGIGVIVGVLLLVIIVNSAGVYYKQSSKVQEGLNINDALLEVRRSIKQASSVAVFYTDGLTTYTSGANQLVLKVSSVDSSGNIIPNIYDYFIFFQNQKFLYFKVFPDPSSSRPATDKMLSNLVDSLNFEYLSSSNPPVEVAAPADAVKVRISLALKQKSGASFEINTATSEANLRND